MTETERIQYEIGTTEIIGVRQGCLNDAIKEKIEKQEILTKRKDNIKKE